MQVGKDHHIVNSHACMHEVLPYYMIPKESVHIHYTPFYEHRDPPPRTSFIILCMHVAMMQVGNRNGILTLNIVARI